MTTSKYKILAYLLLLLLFVTSCEQEPFTYRDFHKTSGVFIVNEGNFTYGNASLSFLDLESNQLENQVFFKANGFPLGDVAYSMTLFDSSAYLSINNSGKVFILNANTFKHQATITGLLSPRHIHITEQNEGIISDLYAPYLTLFNPQTGEVKDSIMLGHSSEQMVEFDGHLFVNSWSHNNKIYKIDLETHRVIDSIQVNKQPNSMVLDYNNQLWVLCDGGYEGSAYGVDYPALLQIDTKNMQILKNFQFPTLAGSPNNLLRSGNRDSLYFLYSSWASQAGFEAGVYRLSIHDKHLPNQPLIHEEGRRFYKLGIDPLHSHIYLTDAKDYLRQGLLLRYRPDGSLIDSFPADRIPGFLSFMIE